MEKKGNPSKNYVLMMIKKKKLISKKGEEELMYCTLSTRTILLQIMKFCVFFSVFYNFGEVLSLPLSTLPICVYVCVFGFILYNKVQFLTRCLLSMLPLELQLLFSFQYFQAGGENILPNSFCVPISPCSFKYPPY